MSQDVRDAVARRDGWQYDSNEREWFCHDARAFIHPIPDDLTACAKAWDEHAGKHGYEWGRDPTVGKVYRVKDDDYDAVPMTGHDAASELRDRWELLGLVLKARGVL